MPTPLKIHAVPKQENYLLLLFLNGNCF